MRLSLIACALLLPLAVQAETIEANSRVVSVTIYPWGASVVRRVEFSAPSGVHELIIPDLPASTPAGSLRIAAAEGLKVGAVNLATGRLPAAEAEPSAEVKAAEDEVERLEALLRDRDTAIAAIRLRVDAANEQWSFLRALGQNRGPDAVAAADAEALRAMVQLIGAETLAARQAAQAAEVEALAAERAKEDEFKALEEAHRVLAALTVSPKPRAVLTLAVEAASDGATSLEVTTYAEGAGWRPVYDLRLTRGETPELVLERSAFVSQASGEDWRGVELMLSTARPAERSNPSVLWPWLRGIVPEPDKDTRYETMAAPGATMSDDSRVREASAGNAMPVDTVAEAAVLAYQGTTVVYRYGNPVDLRDGVEDLRLKLDDLSLAPELIAVAVPSRDATAFLVADLTNGSGQIILPGNAVLYLDGAMVGQTELPLIAAGADQKIGFGAIDGIRLTRTVPERTSGEQGMILSSNQFSELAVLKIENLTGEAWPIRVLDQVPYSEQDDLEVRVTATPPATETDVEGQRGILAWEFELGAGESREIKLEHKLDWPTGFILQ